MYADSAVAGPPQGEWTINDWEALEEGVNGCRYEIIAGVLYMTTAPSNFHQWIVRRLDRCIGIPAEDQGLAICFSAPIGVLLAEGDAVQPDFVLILNANRGIIRERRIRGAPDLIVEVLSPGNTLYEMREKQTMYARAGVPEYVVVDPKARRLSHYRLIEPGRYERPREFAEHETVTLDCLPNLPFVVDQLFADAPDTTL
jgi:Uma2 family endonuclease